jgi:hypothetical protein
MDEIVDNITGQTDVLLFLVVFFLVLWNIMQSIDEYLYENTLLLKAGASVN